MKRGVLFSMDVQLSNLSASEGVKWDSQLVNVPLPEKERWFLANLRNQSIRTEFIDNCRSFMKEQNDAKEKERERQAPYRAERDDFVKWCRTHKFGEHRFTYRGRIGLELFDVIITSTPICVSDKPVATFAHSRSSRAEKGNACHESVVIRCRSDTYENEGVKFDSYTIRNSNYPTKGAGRALGMRMVSRSRYKPVNDYGIREIIDPAKILHLIIRSAKPPFNCLLEIDPPFRPDLEYMAERKSQISQMLIKYLHAVLIPIVYTFSDFPIIVASK
jgi:hypothetical protein